MRIDVLTLFPSIFDGFLKGSLLGKAIAKNLLEVNVVDIRSFTKGRHKIADDKPFGGGPGMVMKIEPVYEALKSVRALKPPQICSKSDSHRFVPNLTVGAGRGDKLSGRGEKDPFVMLLSPQGKVLNQNMAKGLSAKRHLVLICGHYEGIDERITHFIDEEVSAGDYVLNGGEVPAMVVVEAVARMLPGFVKEMDSVVEDSFYNEMLDWPAYTRPAVFKGLKVPEVLLSGDHGRILAWRNKQAMVNTRIKKPYLLREKKK